MNTCYEKAENTGKPTERSFLNINENSVILVRPYSITNTHNNDITIVELPIKFSSKYCSEKKRISSADIYHFFITNSTKTTNLILQLNLLLKILGPDRFPAKIVSLLNYGISIQLTRLFSNSFSRGLFLFILTLSKVVHIY